MKIFDYVRKNPGMFTVTFRGEADKDTEFIEDLLYEGVKCRGVVDRIAEF